MRFSPVLAAVLAATATISISDSVRGQTTDTATATVASAVANKQKIQPTKEPHTRIVNRSIAAPEVMLATSASDLSQASGKVSGQASAIATPQRIAQQDAAPATPQQETPDQIQITPGQPVQQQSPTLPPETQQLPTTPDQPAPTPAPDQPAPTPTPALEQPAPTQPTPTPGADQPTPAPAAEDPRVLVAEVLVRDAEGKLTDALRNEVYRVIQTQAGRTTTRTQLQQDINAIFKTGFFYNVQAVPEDTPLGVRVTFEVRVNPVLQKVQLQGTQVLPDSVVQDAFASQYGTVLNLNELDAGIKKINKWYQDNGYVLAQVIDSPQVSPDGVVTLDVAEGVIEEIQVRFINKDGEETDAKGNPIRGKTRPFIVTREFEQKPGDVFNRVRAERDLQRAFGLNIFEDLRLSLNPGKDPRKVVVVANVVEKNTGNLALGAGISSASGLFGTVSYQQQNFGGNNQKLGAEFQLGERELLFDLRFTDPWIAGDPYRTSYSVNLFKRRSISLIFDGGDPEVELPNGDRPRVNRTGAGISFSRPLSKNVFQRAEWTASLGLQYQRVAIRDRDSDLSPLDELGNELSFSGEGKDDIFSVQFGVVQDRRDSALRPTRGSILRLGTEQTIPIGVGNIFFNRLRASYSFYLPTRLVNFTKECRDRKASSTDCPQVLAFNVQGGTVLGDLPPYEAFSLGGSNSVRGYEEGDLAASRSFIQATAEYRFPIFSFISGAVFLDAATDLGSQNSVLGDPGGVRNKPGSGFGYGIGVRVQSPIGPIRIDYGLNDNGDSRIHFGIGERF